MEKRNTNETFTSVKVMVTTCENKTVNDAHVTVDVQAEDLTTTQSYIASYTGTPGLYCALIPTEPADETDNMILESCKSILTKVGKACDVYNAILKVTKEAPNTVIGKKLEKVWKKFFSDVVNTIAKFNKLMKLVEYIFKGLEWFCKVNDEVTKFPHIDPYEIFCNYVI